MLRGFCQVDGKCFRILCSIYTNAQLPCTSDYPRIWPKTFELSFSPSVVFENVVGFFFALFFLPVLSTLLSERIPGIL